VEVDNLLAQNFDNGMRLSLKRPALPLQRRM
jgi:hypothetical protein